MNKLVSPATGCEMTIWKSFFDNQRCGEPCLSGTYFCVRHVGQLTEAQGATLRMNRAKREQHG